MTCLTGEAIEAGDTVLIGGLCWVAEDVTGLPPSGAGVRLSLDPLECVTGCTDSRCPVGELYYVSRPCDPRVEPIWVCGVTECVIRSCHLLDPATGGVPFNQLPPGATIVPLSSLGPPQPSCCVCDEFPPANCVTSPLTDPRPSQGDVCYTAAQGEPSCCCTRAINEDGSLGPVIRRLRINTYRTVQVIENEGGTPSNNGTITIDILPGSESIDENGCASYIVRTHWEGLGRPPGGETFLSERQTLACEVCGRWWLRAPRLYGDSIRGDGTGAQFLVGFEGNEWGIACEAFPPLTVTEWSANWSCTSMRQTASYVYQVNQTTYTTSFEFEASAVVWGDDPDTCNQRCGGNIDKAKGPPAFATEDFRSMILT